MFVDSDDWIDENMVEKMLNKIVAENVELVTCQYYEFWEDSGNLRLAHIRGNLLGKFDRDSIIYLLKTNFLFKTDIRMPGVIMFLPAKLYKRDILSGVFDSSIDVRFGEDQIALTEIFYKLNSFYIMEDYLYYYRRHSNQIFGQSDDRIWKMAPKYINILKQVDKNGYFTEQIKAKAYYTMLYLQRQNLKKENLPISVVKNRFDEWLKALPETFDLDTSHMTLKQKYRYFVLKHKLLWLCKYL